MQNKRIGIFGGTFDPPHLGHLILAMEAVEQLKLDKLFWVLTPVPPHKLDQLITPLEHRLAMLQAATRDNSNFEISKVEIERPGPHYALDTVSILARQNPDAFLVYLMGGDSLRDLPNWHRPSEFIAACDSLGVVRRPDSTFDLSSLEGILPGITGKVHFVDAPLLEISSREIRKRLSEGRTYRYYLPPPVYVYIRDNDLYR